MKKKEYIHTACGSFDQAEITQIFTSYICLIIIDIWGIHMILTVTIPAFAMPPTLLVTASAVLANFPIL